MENSKTEDRGESQAGNDDEKRLLNSYLQQIARRIDKVKSYPRQAKRKGWEGTVEVEIAILASGEIRQLALHSGSKYKILNEAALKAIEKAGPFSSFPEGIESRSLKVVIPIRFTLRKR